MQPPIAKTVKCKWKEGIIHKSVGIKYNIWEYPTKQMLAVVDIVPLRHFTMAPYARHSIIVKNKTNPIIF